MKRRAFLKRGLQSALITYSFSFCSVYANNIDKELPQSIFSAFVDTLIPEDLTPSASQLHLDGKLIRHAKTIENYTKLIQLGCEWLNFQANSHYQVLFDALNESQKEAVVTLAEENALGSIPRLFFDRVRSDLFQMYYAEPQSWIGLGFNNPPQPAGYPDYVNKFDLTLYD